MEEEGAARRGEGSKRLERSWNRTRGTGDALWSLNWALEAKEKREGCELCAVKWVLVMEDGFVRSRLWHEGREELTSVEALAVGARERAWQVKDARGWQVKDARSELAKGAATPQSWWPGVACTGASAVRLVW